MSHLINFTDFQMQQLLFVDWQIYSFRLGSRLYASEAKHVLDVETWLVALHFLSSKGTLSSGVGGGGLFLF